MTKQSVLWILACALAVIGGFFLVLRTCWLFGYEPSWLPYVAHGAGALLAGFAIGETKRGSIRDAALAGAVGIAILAAVAFAIPQAFGWIAQRSTQPAVAALAIAGGCAVATAAGYALSRGTHDLGVLALATFVTACTVMLGVQIALFLGLPISNMSATLASAALAFVAAFLVQHVAGAPKIGFAGSGYGALLALALVEITKRDLPIDGSIVLLAVPWVAGLVGANAAAKHS